MKLRRWLVLCTLCAALTRTAGVNAQTLQTPAEPERSTSSQQSGAAPVNGTSPMAGAVDPNTYRVGPGDVFRLSITGPLTQDVLLTVGPEGTVVLPGAGTISVKDRTLAQARNIVIERLRREIRGAEIDVRLERPRSFRVYLTGQVKKPGPRTVIATSRVFDVVTPELLELDASVRMIRLQHTDGTIERADLGLFLETGDAASSPFLRDGDIVQVPVARQWVQAAGAVARPGRFELNDGDSLATLLRRAGGLLPDAVEGPLLWLHWREDAHPDSEWIAPQDAVSSARLLASGDRLYAYFIPNHRLQKEVAIYGEVSRPGAYPVTEGVTHLSDVVTEAGGFLAAADLSAIRLHRSVAGVNDPDPELERLSRLSTADLTASEYAALRTKLAGHREDYRLNWATVLRDPASLDIALRGGDIIRVERLVSSIRVDGEVRNPAVLTYRPGATAQDYIRQAGGFTSRAWKGKLRITRAVTGQTLLVRAQDTIGPGDFIWVPERPDRTIWQQATAVLSALAQAATVVIAIRSLR